MTATWTWVLAIFISSFLTIALCLHSEATALELYESSDIGIIILTSATFNATIFSSHTEKEEPVSENLIWFVQFYNTWCGHCQRFAPTWKSLANTTLAWQKSLRLAVLDCSKRENAPVCNQYGVSSYPTMKFFPPRNKIPGNSTNYLGPHTEPGVYLGMLDYMTKIKYPEEIVAVQPKSLGDLWRDDFPNVIDHVALLLESPDSKLGRDVVLSVVGRISYLGLTVRRTTTLNKVLLESMGENVDKEGIRLWLLERHGQKTRIDLSGKENDATAYIDAIFSMDDDLSVAKGFAKPHRPPVPYLEAVLPQDTSLQAAKKSSPKIHPKVVEIYSSNITDLVSSVIYMFAMEVATHKLIEGAEFAALKNIVLAISNVIPFPAQTAIPLRKLWEMLRKKSTTTPLEVLSLWRENGLDVEASPTVWAGCRGSVPGRRGYPCALWQLFHTLTVFALEKKPRSEDSQSAFRDLSDNALDPHSGVLSAIFGYVQYFFTCQECRDNFMQEVEDLRRQTSLLTNREAVLWLWRTHNGVNRRLAGDVTEDEGHPKVQFPSVQQCPNCRLRGSGDVVRWRDDEIVDFFRSFYGLKAGVRQVADQATFNVRDSKHRQMAALEEDPVSSASQTDASSTLKLYLAVVVFVGGAVLGYRRFQRWRKRPIKWQFGFNKTRVKWM